VAEDLQVSGPISGGTHGGPFGASLDDVSTYGYVEEEFFLDGSASTYALAEGATFTHDGRWSTVASEPVPFRTRILVRRPVDPAKFNGTVILEWNNVSMGHDLMMGEVPALATGGYAHVGVSAQRVGIHGAEIMAGMGDPLTSWDPERYGSLNVPSEDLSYGIFSAAAEAVGPKRATSPADPMGGLHVERVVATGGSQSAQRMVTYINGVHPLDHVIDGFIPLVQAGPIAPLVTPDGVDFSPFADETGEGNFGDITAPLPQVFFKIRDDLDVPVIAFNSEVDAQYCIPMRRPDTDRFRTWEIAGTSHGGDAMARQLELDQRDLPDYQPMMAPDPSANNTSWTGPLLAALHHLDVWIATGTPPPSVPLLEVGDEPGEFRRDEHGNALGGVRLPHVEAPIATVRGQGDADAGWLMGLMGKVTPFSDEQLRALYGDHATYVARVQAAADACVAAGTLLPRDAADIVAAAESSSILT
jgi:hypothetical protein